MESLLASAPMVGPWWGRVGGGMHMNPLHQLLTKTLTLYPFNEHFINKSLEKEQK